MTVWRKIHIKIMIISNFEKITVNINTSHIEKWSTLSNTINYVQDNRMCIDCHKLDVKALEPKATREYMISRKKVIGRLLT